MDFRWRFDSADKGAFSASGSDVRKKFLKESPTDAFSGESRYLTPLQVSGNGEISDSSQSTTSGFKLGAITNDLHAKIRATLKLLSFREHRVIIQFWLPHDYGKHKYLTTADQPFGFGVIDEEVLSYRRHSVDNPVVVKDLEERDHNSPLARVFRHRLPEWTIDITNYSPRHFAIRCNFHGYMALPVFDSTAESCVGVLELLTTSKYISYAFEVRQVHRALEMADLTSPQAFDCPALDVHNEQKHNVLEKIFRVLKEVCSVHKLPLAQTWAVSPSSSFACHEQILEKTCNSFDTRCLKKVCMSTAALPFHVQDLSMWPFWKTCRRRHLDQSRTFVGRVLLSRSSWFCRDVTKLGEDEYPLVYNARMSGLTSCFAIFLHSVEVNDDYVLELFLPLDMEDGRDLPKLVQTIKENLEIASEFELGDTSCMQVVGPPPKDVTCLSLNTHPNTVQISSNATSKSNILETISSDSESMVTNLPKTESANVPNQLLSKQNDSNNYSGIITATENLTVGLFGGDVNVLGARQNENTTSYPAAGMQKKSKSDMITDAGDKRNHLKQGRKRKVDSLTMEAVQQHLGKPIGEAAKSLNVSRSTLKRFCREHEMQSWPSPKHNKKAATISNLKLPQRSGSEQQLQQPTNVLSSMHVVVFLLTRVKRWSCSGKRHVFSGRWWSCGKHSYLPAKSDYIYQVAHLMLQLRRWRNNVRHALQKRDHTAMSESTSKPKYTTNITNPHSHLDWQLPKPILVHASAKQNTSDISMVTVKATYKDDMIKFPFHTSSGLLELENQVAQRINMLKSRRFRLKYMDEDNDLILLACDADIRNLLFSTSVYWLVGIKKKQNRRKQKKISKSEQNCSLHPSLHPSLRP